MRFLGWVSGPSSAGMAASGLSGEDGGVGIGGVDLGLYKLPQDREERATWIGQRHIDDSEIPSARGEFA